MKSIRKHPLHSYLLPPLDAATIVASLIVAVLLRGRSFTGNFTLIGAPLYSEIVFMMFYAAACTFIFRYLNLYTINVFTTTIDHSLRILKALLYTVVGIAILSFFTKAKFIVDSRLAIFYFAGVAFLMFLGGRVVLFRILFLWTARHSIFRRNLLIIGAGDIGKNMAANVALHYYLGLHLVGFLDDDLPLGRTVFRGAKVLGRVNELKDVVNVFDIHEIVICLENVDHTRLIQVLEEAILTRATVKISSPLYDVIPARLDIEKYGTMAVVGISQFGPSRTFKIYKRFFDAVAAAAGVLFLLPVFLTIALAIKLSSPGPIFFKQVRIGKDGQPFDFYKFRSMRVGTADLNREEKLAKLIKGEWKGAKSGDVPMKIVDEKRITPVGAFLRRTSLDELPQLFNVLKGDMSLVGPRPCLPYEWKYYDEWHKKRLSVTPGCTGMWQVLGRSEVGFEDMVVLDLFYSHNLSFHLDLWLILKTIPVMVLGKGGK